MRTSNNFQSWFGGLVAVAVVAPALGAAALASDGVPLSIVGDLSSGADLAPLAVESRRSIDLNGAKSSVAAVKSFARQSVPARDRADSYRDGEVFRNSKVALPLLVVDLEPQGAIGIRPMAGRSVGARPAAAWTRAATSAPVVAPGAERSSRLSSFGQR